MIRYHRGLSAELRRTLRKAGMDLDEETAQRMLSGFVLADGIPAEVCQTHRAEVFEASARRHLMHDWEQANPVSDPFPPAFPERVLTLVRAVAQALEEENIPKAQAKLDTVTTLCLAEMEFDQPIRM
jgi:hypothetical protein